MHSGFASELMEAMLRKPEPFKMGVNPADFCPGGRHCIYWTVKIPAPCSLAQRHYLLLPRLFAIHKDPRRQSLEQRPSVPLLTRLAELQETHRELSRNTHKAQRRRVAPSRDSSRPIPGESTGWSGKGCFQKGKSLSLNLRAGSDNLMLQGSLF